MLQTSSRIEKFRYVAREGNGTLVESRAEGYGMTEESLRGHLRTYGLEPIEIRHTGSACACMGCQREQGSI